MSDSAGLPMIDSSVVLAARVLLGAVLAVTGIGKLANHRTFVLIVRSHKLVPEASVAALCWFLPITEIVLATLLFSGTLLPLAALGAAGLLVAFSVAISLNLVRGHRDAPCGCCGDANSGRIGWHMVLRNLGLIGLAAVSGGGMGSFVPYVALLSILLIILPVAAGSLRQRVIARRTEEPS